MVSTTISVFFGQSQRTQHETKLDLRCLNNQQANVASFNLPSLIVEIMYLLNFWIPVHIPGFSFCNFFPILVPGFRYIIF